MSRSGNIDDEPIPDHFDVPHEETDDDFKNTLIDSEGESESDSDFRDIGYVDPTSSYRKGLIWSHVRSLMMGVAGPPQSEHFSGQIAPGRNPRMLAGDRPEHSEIRS